jgi:hypothetical protein
MTFWGSGGIGKALPLAFDLDLVGAALAGASSLAWLLDQANVRDMAVTTASEMKDCRRMGCVMLGIRKTL